MDNKVESQDGNTECKLKQKQNAQFQEEVCMEVDFENSIHENPQVPPMDELSEKTQQVIQSIQNIQKQVEENDHLQKYFRKAGTNAKEIKQSLARIREQMVRLKQTIDLPNANHIIITTVSLFLYELLSHFDMSKQSNIDKAIWILEFQTKISCSFQLISSSLFCPFDITTVPKSYPSTWENVEFEVLGNEKKIVEELKYLKKVLGITTSAVLNEREKDWGITKILSFGLSYPKYFISNKEGQLRSMNFYRKPNVEMAKHIWNLPQNGMTRELAKINMKSIVTNIKIYIPWEEGKLPQNILKDDGQSIQVRVLHNQSIYLRMGKDMKKSSFGCICQSSIQKESQSANIDTVIVHMHGGGFLALSSRSMQTYTRRWARELKIPVFSIDYRMPEEHPFPVAPYDCLRVYEFLVNHIHKFMNVKPTKIILAGDSAGGNLSFSLMGLILKHKLPPPIGIFAAYPATDLRFKFSPSKIYSFTDPLLHPPMLLLCLHQYLKGDETKQLDPLASPILLTEQYVGGQKGDTRFPINWPKTRIQVGAKDPLYDDSIKILQKMLKSGIDAKCQVYRNMSHGFLNLDFVIADCKKTINDSIKHLREFLPAAQMPKTDMIRPSHQQ